VRLLRGWFKNAEERRVKAELVRQKYGGPEPYSDATGFSVEILGSMLNLADPTGRADVIAMIREHQPDAIEGLLALYPEVPTC